MRRKLIDLCATRSKELEKAEAALNANDQETYAACMVRIKNMNTEIENIQALIREQDRKVMEAPANPAEQRDMAEDRGAILMRGDDVQISAAEVRRMFNSTTVATGTIVQPTGAGTNIHDPVGNQVSSIIDQVTVQDLTGMGAYQEPYVKAEMEAQSQKVETAAGTARTATDPTFGIAELRPREVNVTSFVDRNIARLSPADYYAKVMTMAMRAMRRAIAKMIITGDGEGSPAMFGITNAKNKASENIFAEETITAIDATTLDQLYFAYGSDVAIGANARLLLTKKNLKAFGALRGTNEKRRLLDIVPDMANPNTGIIRDGGVVIPYTISADVTDEKLLYGDPANYLLGLFGAYSIRVDESVKAVERMYAILGDVMVGGNLVVDKGFVVGTVGGGG